MENNTNISKTHVKYSIENVNKIMFLLEGLKIDCGIENATKYVQLGQLLKQYETIEEQTIKDK